MPDSPYNSILDAVVTAVGSLGLTYNGTPLPVLKRKLPAVDETVDTLPMICVVPQEKPEAFKPWAFGKTLVVYYTEVVSIHAGNRNLTTDLDVELFWRDKVLGLFNVSKQANVAAVVTSLWDTDVNPDVPVDRAKVSDNYDYSGIGLGFKTVRNLGA